MVPYCLASVGVGDFCIADFNGNCCNYKVFWILSDLKLNKKYVFLKNFMQTMEKSLGMENMDF